jgi:site-specific recombinase XerD
MRHTGVSHSMEMGVDPRYVQAQARHSSLNITARYDHKKRQAWRDAFNAADNSKK